MKNWNKPEMNVFSVKMDENIASSVSGGSTAEKAYLTGKIFFGEAGEKIYRYYGNYYFTEDCNIQDTGITFKTYQYPERLVPLDQMGLVDGCKA